MQTEIEKLKNRLRSAGPLVVLTGAGVSAESGVPTFRGADGLWQGHNPQELATPEAFEADPFLVWEWYDWRRSIISRIQPNPAHYAIAELEKRFLEFTLITQNVDGLHAQAGSRKLIELHGSIWRVQCVECGNSSENRVVPIKILPRCSCGGLLRPGVVWFGEPLPEEALFRAFEASSNAAVMLVVGTSGVVQPAASLALRASGAGAFVAEINPEETPLSPAVDLRLAGPAGKLMPTLL